MNFHWIVVFIAVALAIMGFCSLAAVAVLERDWIKGAIVAAAVLVMVAFIYKLTRERR